MKSIHCVTSPGGSPDGAPGVLLDPHRTTDLNSGMNRWAAARRGSGGFTLLETMMAAFVILTVMGAVFAVSAQCIRMNKSAHDVTVASSALNERVQQLQNTDWETLTDSDSYTDQVWTDPVDNTTQNVSGLLKTATVAGGELRNQGGLESVRISAYRPTANASPVPTPITATRNATTAALTSAATNLVDEKMVRIDLRLTWTDNRMGTQRSLASSRIVARK